MDGRSSRPARALVIAALAFGVAVGSAVVGGLHAQPAAPAVPPAGGAPDAARGKTVYEAKCAECHGVAGKGDGPAAMLMAPRPRDFTAGKYKIRSTEASSIPTDDDLLRVVRLGMPGSAMPAWEGLLGEADQRAVVDYIKRFSPRFAGEQPQPLAFPAAPPSTPETVARGKQAFGRLQCAGCHGVDGRGTGAIATDFEDDWGGPLNAADLTAPWTFRGGASARDVYTRLRTGITGTPMPSFAEAAKDADLLDVAAYVVSLARKPVWEMGADDITAHFRRAEDEAKADPVKRGRALVNALACTLCHSPVDADRRVLPGMKLAGGMRIRLGPFGDYPAGNLTSDKETGLGAWTDDEIKQTLTRGVLRDGTRLLPFPMDWPSYSTMKPEDLNAIVAYLRTVPPVYNKVPPPSRPVLPAYLWAKFQVLVLGQDQPLVFFPGNAGTTKGGGQ